MLLGIFAKTFEGTDPATVLTQAKTAGFASVQYNMACSGIGSLPAVVPDDVAKAVAEASTTTGVEVAAISATYNMIHPDLTVRQKGRVAFEAIASSCRTMGTRLVTLCTGSRDAQDQWHHHPDNQTAGAWTDMLREFDLLLPIAEQYDLVLGVEPEMANVVNSAHQARSLIDTLRSERVRIVLDAANLFEVQSTAGARAIVDEAVDLLADVIVMAHAKDRRADGSFTTAGRGIIDYPAYIDGLKRAGFDGAIVTHGLTASEAPDVAAYLRETVARDRSS